MTVFEQIKGLTVSELATICLQFSETKRTAMRCDCPVGALEHGKGKGFCRPDRSCALCIRDWLQSEDEIDLDVPVELIEEGDDP